MSLRPFFIRNHHSVITLFINVISVTPSNRILRNCWRDCPFVAIVDRAHSHVHYVDKDCAAVLARITCGERFCKPFTCPIGKETNGFV
jgi:hypothetical protein